MLSDLGRRQASSWSEDARVAPLLHAVDVCLSSPLRRAFQTASRVFRRTTNARFAIVAQRLAREKWWHLHQCRGVPHARLVQFLADEGIHNARGVDGLARVDEDWDPLEEAAIMREGRPNEFRRQSADALRRLREDELQRADGSGDAAGEPDSEGGERDGEGPESVELPRARSLAVSAEPARPLQMPEPRKRTMTAPAVIRSWMQMRTASARSLIGSELNITCMITASR